jgi:hypothetical protein
MRLYGKVLHGGVIVSHNVAFQIDGDKQIWTGCFTHSRQGAFSEGQKISLAFDGCKAVEALVTRQDISPGCIVTHFDGNEPLP